MGGHRTLGLVGGQAFDADPLIVEFWSPAGYWLLSVVGAEAAYIMGSVETGRSDLSDEVVRL